MSRYTSPWWIVGVLVATFGYFYQAGGWNQNTRFDLVRAVVEEHRIAIDSFHQNTGDKSQVGDHFYSDKAPGQSFLAVPFVAALRVVLGVAGIAPDSTLGIDLQTYVATFATSAIPTVVSVLCLIWLVRKLGGTDDAALFTGVAFALATPALPYATLFFAHALSASCLLVSFCTLVAMGEARSSPSAFALGLVSGFAAGWAVLVEYHAAPVAVLIAIAHLLEARSGDRSRLVPIVSGVGLGAAMCIGILMAYNAAAFGSPFSIGYEAKLAFADMDEGLFGVTYPRWERLSAILFGRFRGLLPIAPVLIAAPLGMAFVLRSERTRRYGGLALVIGLYFILLHASFVNWHGGWAYGPRYMLPGLPFLCLPLAAAWTHVGKVGRVVMLALTLYGGGLNFVATAVNPTPPQQFTKPFRELYWPAFRSGDFPLNRQTFLDRRPRRGREAKVAAWNLGNKLGLEGHASLIPLYLFWVVMGFVGWKLYARPTT